MPVGTSNQCDPTNKQGLQSIITREDYLWVFRKCWGWCSYLQYTATLTSPIHHLPTLAESCVFCLSSSRFSVRSLLWKTWDELINKVVTWLKANNEITGRCEFWNHYSQHIHIHTTTGSTVYIQSVDDVFSGRHHCERCYRLSCSTVGVNILTYLHDYVWMMLPDLHSALCQWAAQYRV